MVSRMTKDDNGEDPNKLERCNWAPIWGKDGIATVFVSVYRLYHNPDGLHIVWRQQSRHFKEK